MPKNSWTVKVFEKLDEILNIEIKHSENRMLRRKVIKKRKRTLPSID